MNIPAIRPLQGQVLVMMLDPDSMERGLHLPDQAKGPPVKGKVLRHGCWPQAKSGALLPYGFARGDTVLINQYVGKKLAGYPENYKLVKHTDILAVLE